MDTVGVILIIAGSVAALIMFPPRMRGRAQAGHVSSGTHQRAYEVDHWYDTAADESDELAHQYPTWALWICGTLVAVGVAIVVV